MIASIAAYAFAVMVGGDATNNPTYESAALQKLVYAYGANCLLAAACVWMFVPDSNPIVNSKKDEGQKRNAGSLRNLVLVLGSPAIWRTEKPSRARPCARSSSGASPY